MFRRRSPEEKVQAELATMRQERADNERDCIGLINRPRYMRSKHRLTGMGADSVGPLIRLIEETPAPPSDREQRTIEDELNIGIAADAGEILAEIGDPRAVAPMLDRIDDFFGLHYALARTPDGVRALIDTLADPDGDSDVRFAAVSGLGAAATRKDDAMQALLGIVASREKDVLPAAVMALGVLGDGDQRAIDALAALVADEQVDEGMRITAQKRLDYISRNA
jgi:HEAT repeat protein